MASNATFWLDWNRDFLLTPSGSIQTAVGWDAFRQRVVRRAITNPAQELPNGVFTPADYIFEPDFGVGLGTLVDQPFDADSLSDIERRLTLAVLQDPDADPTSPPAVLFRQPTPSELDIFISAATTSGQSGTIALKGA